MDSSHHISNESFSNSWTICINSSTDTQQHCSSFTETDTDFFSMRWISDANDFGLSVPRMDPLALDHAEEIISNGSSAPIHAASAPTCSTTHFGSAVCSRSQSVNSSASMLSRSGRHDHKCYSNAVCSGVNSETSSPAFYSSHSTPSSSKSLLSKGGSFKSLSTMRSCVKSPKKILCRYLSFMMPVYKKVRGLRLRTLQQSRSCAASSQNSTRTSSALSSIEWCRSNADISIYDAILHCKRSNGQE